MPPEQSPGIPKIRVVDPKVSVYSDRSMPEIVTRYYVSEGFHPKSPNVYVRQITREVEVDPPGGLTIRFRPSGGGEIQNLPGHDDFSLRIYPEFDRELLVRALSFDAEGNPGEAKRIQWLLDRRTPHCKITDNELTFEIEEQKGFIFLITMDEEKGIKAPVMDVHPEVKKRVTHFDTAGEWEGETPWLVRTNFTTRPFYFDLGLLIEEELLGLEPPLILVSGFKIDIGTFDEIKAQLNKGFALTDVEVFRKMASPYLRVEREVPENLLRR